MAPSLQGKGKQPWHCQPRFHAGGLWAATGTHHRWVNQGEAQLWDCPKGAPGSAEGPSLYQPWDLAVQPGASCQGIYALEELKCTDRISTIQGKTQSHFCALLKSPTWVEVCRFWRYLAAQHREVTHLVMQDPTNCRAILAAELLHVYLGRPDVCALQPTIANTWGQLTAGNSTSASQTRFGFCLH